MKLKPFFALFLAFMLLFSLTGCQNNSGLKFGNQKESSTVTTDDGAEESLQDNEKRITAYLLVEDYDGLVRKNYEYADGNMTLEVYNSQGEETRRNVYEYDNRGNMISWISYWCGEVDNRYLYEYDENGIKTKMISYKNNKEDKVYTYNYDDTGNMVLELVFFEGNEVARSEFTYDANGNTIKAEHSAGYTIETIEYEYDEAGNLTLEAHYGSNFAESFRFEYIYDDHGKRVEQLFYVEGVENRHDTYEYDANGNLILEISYNQGNEVSRASYEYENDILQRVVCLRDGHETVYLTEYQKMELRESQVEKMLNDAEYSNNFTKIPMIIVKD